MSRPPINRENSSTNLVLNQQDTKSKSEKDDKAAEQAAKSPPPQLNQKTEANQTPPSGDAGFSKEDWSKHGQGSDEQPAKNQEQTKEKSSQGDEQKSSGKPADTVAKGKAAPSTRKVNVPSLKLGGSGTATLKSRAPVSPDSLSALGSHRTMSPRTGDVTPANSSSSASTTNANTQGQAPSSAQSSAPPTRSLPPVPQNPSSQTPSVSTSNVPTSASSAATTARVEHRVIASSLSGRSLKILDSALTKGKKLDDKVVNGKVVEGKIVNANIDPEDLGYLMVEVQTAGFTSATSKFTQGMPFLRAGLVVFDFKDSNGVNHNSINIVDQFLMPMTEKIFNTQECNNVFSNLEENYLEQASSIEKAAGDLTSKQAQETEEIKNTLEELIRPVTAWICGENETLDSSNFPDSWKLLLCGIDDAVVHWAKKINCTNREEFKALRSEAMVAFISTRGPMMLWGLKLQTHGKKVGLLISYLNSYFAKRADKFITNIMLSRKDSKGDAFDRQIRADLTMSARKKELMSKAPITNASGRRELMKSKTLSYTKTAPASSSATVDKESTALSPREIKQTQYGYERQKFFRDFSRLAKLATLEPDFYRLFKTHVNEMTPREFKNFKKNPMKICTNFLVEFYKGVSDKDIQEKVKAIRAALAAIDSKDIAALVPEARKAKSIVKTESELLGRDKEISQERKIKFLGEFAFYTNTNAISKDFLISFRKYILELSVAEYVKFEATPIASGLAFVEKWYSSFVAISPRADRNRLADEKKQLIDSLNNIHVDSIKGLKDSMEASSKPTSDAGSVVASPRLNLEFPANPFAEDEQQATILPTTTASTQLPQDSRTLPSSAVGLNLVRENEISAERRIDFLNKFLKLANIHDISEDFNNAFNKSILELSSIDYEKFLGNPIAACRDYVNHFYDLPIVQTNQSQASVNEDKPAFLYFLSWIERKNLEAINALATANAAPTSIVGTAASTASTQPPKDSRTLPVASVGVNPVAKDVESEKTEPSSESEIVTESDSDADNASSEKTEES